MCTIRHVHNGRCLVEARNENPPLDVLEDISSMSKGRVNCRKTSAKILHTRLTLITLIG